MLVARYPDREAEKTAAAASASQALFPVSTIKFLVLSICSLNLYQIYWFYQNWRRIRDTTGAALSPFWRAVFPVVWVIPLMRHISRRAEESGVTVRWRAIPLGVAFILMSWLLRLPDPWWLVALGTGVLLAPVVETCRQINNAAQDPEGLNAGYSAANVATIVIGGLFLVLLVISVFQVGVKAPPVAL